MIIRALAKCLRVAAIYPVREETVHKYVLVAASVDEVATKLVDALSFTELVAKFVKHDIERSSLD